MRNLSEVELQFFEQTLLGANVHVFGNIATAFGVCRNIENGETEVRGVEAYLLLKEDDRWRIASQTWDTESEGKTIPSYLRNS